MRGGFARRGLAAAAAGVAIAGAAAPAQALMYVRAGGALDFSFFSRLADEDCFSIEAFFGCDPGSDGQPTSAMWDFDDTLTAEVAIGMRLLIGLRAEVMAIWRPVFEFDGEANFAGFGDDQPVSGEGWNMAVMANAYLDLVEMGLPPLGPFEPFIGAGIGLAYNSLGPLTFSFPGLSAAAMTIVLGGDSASLAYMATAGVSWPLFAGVRLDIAYRFTDLGTVGTDAGWAEIISDAGSSFAQIGATETNLRSHGLVASLRLGF